MFGLICIGVGLIGGIAVAAFGCTNRDWRRSGTGLYFAICAVLGACLGALSYYSYFSMTDDPGYLSAGTLAH